MNNDTELIVFPRISQVGDDISDEDRELAMALALSLVPQEEVMGDVDMAVESGGHDGADTPADGPGAAGDVVGPGSVGGGMASGETEQNRDVDPQAVTTVLQGYLSQMVHSQELNPAYVARLAQDTTLRAIIVDSMQHLDDKYDMKGAVSDAVDAIRQAEEEEEMDRDIGDW